MEAEKKAQEATIEKEREEAKKQAEELKRQQQRLEAERRAEEIKRREEEHRAQKREEEHRRESESLEAQKRAEEHRRWHKKHHSHHHYDDRNHYHYNNRYNDESTIIYTEQYYYYNEPYPDTNYPAPNYDQPYSGNLPPKTIAPPAGQIVSPESGISEEKAVMDILESEAFVPNIHISEASPDFCKSFMKSLKANNGEVIFEKPVVSTDDPESTDLARNFPCYKKAGDEEYIAKSLSMAGEQNFKLYRLKKDLSSKNSDYEYMLYTEPASATGRSDLIPGFWRIDKNTCKIKQEVTVNENNPDAGNFSSIVKYKKQYYILDIALKGNETEQTQKHIIKLHQYSSKKGIFEQSPYAYWAEPYPIN